MSRCVATMQVGSRVIVGHPLVASTYLRVTLESWSHPAARDDVVTSSSESLVMQTAPVLFPAHEDETGNQRHILWSRLNM